MRAFRTHLLIPPSKSATKCASLLHSGARIPPGRVRDREGRRTEVSFRFEGRNHDPVRGELVTCQISPEAAESRSRTVARRHTAVLSAASSSIDPGRQRPLDLVTLGGQQRPAGAFTGLSSSDAACCGT